MLTGNHAAARAVNAKNGRQRMLPSWGALTRNMPWEGNIRCLPGAIVALVLALYAGGTTQCLAGTAPSPARDAVITTLRSDLEQSAAAERRWANTWGTIWVVAVFGQGAAMPFVGDAATRVDLGFGAASAALGFIPTWIMPPRAVSLWREGQAQGKDRDEAWLRQALDADQRDKAARRGWVAHGSNVAVNLALGAIQAYAIDHKTEALITVLAGIPVGIVMIETQPRQKRTDFAVTLAPTLHGAWAAVSLRF